MRRGGWILLLMLAGAVLVLVGTREQASQDPPPDTSTRTEAPGASQGLPPEVAETVALIEAGGPFPYDRDGAVFMNREGLLPQRERGYWREYTVPTPGESDRGARRVVAGRDGELYYTADHYGSFVRLEDPR